ncbi:MAG: Ribosome biogenesis protein erb1 [Piccolia ochrophora]|nr:MAG: Ribosome biogenesis protein erb1 [Piccolia ochrophora]
MAPNTVSKKRKAVTRHAPTEVSTADGASVGEFDASLTNGFESGTDEETEEEDSEADPLDEVFDEESEGLDSDEIPPENESAIDQKHLVSKLGSRDRGGVSISPGVERNGRLNGVSKNSKDHEAPLEETGHGEGEGANSEEEEGPNFTVTEDANGNPRYIYKEIEPVYDSDDSDAPPNQNTIGNIPLSFYETYPHIGYDINGKKVMRPAKGEALDALLDSIEVPQGWTGLTDPATGKALELSQQELLMLKRIQLNELPVEGFDPYPPTIEYFTSKVEQMPLSAAPEPKRRFVPSKHEAKRVMKLVRAIREGRILPYKPPSTEEDKDLDLARYDIWANETPRPDHAMNVPAPKLPPPGYDQSYNPPPEYLPTKSERKAWEEAEDEDREKEYLPTRHDALRKVPGYETFVKERFERSLDLYLAPRVRRSKLNIDPESLLPKLPSPDELRPFPTTCATVFKGHEGRVRTLAIDPTGVWLASGGDDGSVKIWELLTGREIFGVQLEKDEAVNVVRWRPSKETAILTVAIGDYIYFIVPPNTSPTIESASHDLLDAGFGYAATNASSAPKKDPAATWIRPAANLVASSVLLRITVRSPVKTIAFHRRGDYFTTVSPKGQSSAVAIHTISKHQTQLPFRRLKGLAQSSAFHPSKPILYVATQRSVRVYDLAAQSLLKTLQPGARWISSLDTHPAGDHLLVGSYDRRLAWLDLDLSPRPYKTLRYHAKAIRAVRFHKGGLPLFADASDDGSVQVFHGNVVDDLMENATIVPLKVLKGHKVVGQLGVLDLDWHPSEPWCVSAGADGSCRLWM